MVGEGGDSPVATWVAVDGIKGGGDRRVGEGGHESGLVLVEVAEQLDEEDFSEAVGECLGGGFEPFGSGDGELGEVGPSGVAVCLAVDDRWEGLQQWVVEFAVVGEVAT